MAGRCYLRKLVGGPHAKREGIFLMQVRNWRLGMACDVGFADVGKTDLDM